MIIVIIRRGLFFPAADAQLEPNSSALTMCAINSIINDLNGSTNHHQCQLAFKETPHPSPPPTDSAAMISRRHDRQLQRGGRCVQRKTRYIHTKAFRSLGRRNETRTEGGGEEGGREGAGATKRRGDERAFLQEEEIYSVGLVQI